MRLLGHTGGNFAEQSVFAWVDWAGGIRYDTCMETITVDVPDALYRDFQDYAKRVDRTASELIREAMELYRHQKIEVYRARTRARSHECPGYPHVFRREDIEAVGAGR